MWGRAEVAWDACLRSAALLRGRAASGGFALRETVGVVFGRLRYSDGRYCVVEIGSGRGGEAVREPMRSRIVGEASAC